MRRHRSLAALGMTQAVGLTSSYSTLSVNKFSLNFRGLGDIFKAYSSLNFDTDQIDPTMFARFPLHAQRPGDRLSRLADWWPAALIGVLALLAGAPDSNAQTLLSLF